MKHLEEWYTMTLGLIQTSPCAAEYNTMDISIPITYVNLSKTKKNFLTFDSTIMLEQTVGKCGYTLLHNSKKCTLTPETMIPTAD